MLHDPASFPINPLVEVARVSYDEVNLYCGFFATNTGLLNWDIAVDVARDFQAQVQADIRAVNVFMRGHTPYFICF